MPFILFFNNFHTDTKSDNLHKKHFKFWGHLFYANKSIINLTSSRFKPKLPGNFFNFLYVFPFPMIVEIKSYIKKWLYCVFYGNRCNISVQVNWKGGNLIEKDNVPNFFSSKRHVYFKTSCRQFWISGDPCILFQDKN